MLGFLPVLLYSKRGETWLPKYLAFYISQSRFSNRGWLLSILIPKFPGKDCNWPTLGQLTIPWPITCDWVRQFCAVLRASHILTPHTILEGRCYYKHIIDKETERGVFRRKA